MVVVEALAHAHGIGGLLRVFAKAKVVPAGSVFKQVHDAHRIRRFPAIFKPDIGSELVNGIFERKFALIGQQQDGERSESL
jgi:hypothetical protein